MSYWVKYGASYVGSGKPYHPHEFYILTTLNGAFDGLSFDYLTAYIEQNVRTINGVTGGVREDRRHVAGESHRASLRPRRRSRREERQEGGRPEAAPPWHSVRGAFSDAVTRASRSVHRAGAALRSGSPSDPDDQDD